MTDKELEEAASGFLDMAFNLGEPAAAVSEHIGGMFVQHNPQGRRWSGGIHRVC
jgi:hypothetical protein